MRLCAIAAALLVVCSGTACSGGGAEERPRSPVEPSAARVVQVVGGDARDRALVRRLAAGTRPRYVVRVELLRSDGSRRLGLGDRARPFLAFSVRVTADRELAPATWEAMLLGGALTDALPPRLRPTGVSVIAIRDGVQEPLASLPGVSRSRFGRNSALSAGDAVAELRAVAAEVGLDVRAARTLRPLGFAVAAQLTLGGDPTAFVREPGRYFGPITARLVDPERPRLDGLFIEVLSADGDVVQSTGYASRLGVGSGWENPRYRKGK